MQTSGGLTFLLPILNSGPPPGTQAADPRRPTQRPSDYQNTACSKCHGNTHGSGTNYYSPDAQASQFQDHMTEV